MNTSVQILEGPEGIKQAYQESLRQPTLDIVCLAENYQTVIGNFFETTVVSQLYGAVKTREILPDNPANRTEAKGKDPAINAVRFIKASASESDMLLWADRVVLVSFGTKPMAVCITDLEIVSSLQQQFEALWERLG
ncbi:MAG TPA: hypothetical protein VLE99_06885 [Candidatus Saccharimonadales bacterium]|nr:hypothetical protein [Candidatus Saccharimonadales bacterium]